MPGVSSTIRWLSSVGSRSPASGASHPQLVPSKPRRAKAQRCRTSLCLISASACPPPVLGGTPATTNLGFLLSSHDIFLGLGRSKLFVKLTTLSPIFLGGLCWIFSSSLSPGSSRVPCRYPVEFFSQTRLLPFVVTISGLLLHRQPAEGFPLTGSSSPPPP